MESAENGNKVMKDRIFEGENNLDLLDEKLREVKMASKELDDLMQTLRSRLQRSLLIDKKYALYRNRYILRTGEVPPSDLLENPYIDVEYVKEEENEGMNQGEPVEEEGASNYNNEEEMNNNEGEMNNSEEEMNKEANSNEQMTHHEEIDVEVNHEGDIEVNNNMEEMTNHKEVEDSNSAIPEEETQESDPSEPTIEPPSPIDEPELNESDDSAMMGTPFPEPPVIEEDPMPEEYEEEYDEGENHGAYEEDYDEANEDYHESYDDYDYENDDDGRYDDEDDPYNSDHFDESEETKVISDDQLCFSVQISALPSLDDVNSIDVFVFIHPFIHFLL